LFVFLRSLFAQPAGGRFRIKPDRASNPIRRDVALLNKRVDLHALEKMFVDAGVAAEDQLKRTAEEEGGLGLFIRSLIGLDRAAAKQAFSQFLQGRTLTTSQLDFVNLIVDHLTQCGWMRPEQLYSSPFTDEFANGPNAVFTDEAVLQDLIRILTTVQENAAGQVRRRKDGAPGLCGG
jgi:type I restriction enzyme R subunit